MGWCSGTEIFDVVAGTILDKYEIDLLDYDTTVTMLIQVVKVMEDHDWDCHSDSGLYGNPLVQDAFKQLHPNWFEIGD